MSSVRSVLQVAQGGMSPSARTQSRSALFAVLRSGAAITFGKAAKLRSLMAYTLKPTSPLLDKGLNLHALFGVDAGPHDFYGTPIPSNGQFEVGAYEAPENSKASIAVKASGSARR